MNKSKRDLGAFAMIGGGAYVLFISIIKVNEEFSFIKMTLILGVYWFFWGIYHYFTYSTAYKIEEQEEKERRKKQIEQQQIALKKKNEKINNIRKTPFERIDKMSRVEFEEYCTVLLNDLGYKATKTKTSGDFGADIIARKGNDTIVIQTKRYSSKVSVSAVQEVFTAKKYYNASSAWIITNNEFTKPAKQLANVNLVKLIDRNELAALVSKIKS